nr:hypothetical protein SARC_03642 [Ipomoea batatas]
MRFAGATSSTSASFSFPCLAARVSPWSPLRLEGCVAVKGSPAGTRASALRASALGFVGLAGPAFLDPRLIFFAGAGGRAETGKLLIAPENQKHKRLTPSHRVTDLRSPTSTNLVNQSPGAEARRLSSPPPSEACTSAVGRIWGAPSSPSGTPREIGRSRTRTLRPRPLQPRHRGNGSSWAACVLSAEAIEILPHTDNPTKTNSASGNSILASSRPAKSPAASPTKSLAVSPAKSLTASPAKSLAASPAKAPAASPTTTPPASPTTTPPASPTNTPPASPTNTPPASSTNTPPANSTNTPPANSTNTPPASSTKTPPASPATSAAPSPRKMLSPPTASPSNTNTPTAGSVSNAPAPASDAPTQDDSSVGTALGVSAALQAHPQYSVLIWDPVHWLAHLIRAPSKIGTNSGKTVPEGGSHRRLRALKKVDFPLPLGPIIPTITPLGISTLTLLSTCGFCSDLGNSPWNDELSDARENKEWWWAVVKEDWKKAPSPDEQFSSRGIFEIWRSI